MKLKVEKGVPLPAPTARQGSNIALLKSMQVGDSVFFDDPVATKAQRFYRVAQKLGIKIVIRNVDGGKRLWRTADTRETPDA
jgi:hypothetical protein